MAQDYNAAVDTFNSGIQSESKLEKLELVRTALQQFEACSEDEAAEMIEKCKEYIPNILIDLGKEKINEKLYDEAVECFKEAIELAEKYEQPEDVKAKALKFICDALKRKGATLIKANDYAGAIAVLKDALEYNGEDAVTWLYLTQAYFKSNAYEDAVEAGLKASELGQAAKAGKLLFNAYIKLGDTRKASNIGEAISFYEKAFELDENAKLAMKIGNTYLQGGMYAKAISFYKKYIEIDPEASDANDVIWTIAATAQKGGDNATAIEYYSKLVSDAKYSAQALQQLNQLNK